MTAKTRSRRRRLWHALLGFLMSNVLGAPWILLRSPTAEWALFNLQVSQIPYFLVAVSIYLWPRKEPERQNENGRQAQVAGRIPLRHRPEVVLPSFFALKLTILTAAGMAGGRPVEGFLFGLAGATAITLSWCAGWYVGYRRTGDGRIWVRRHV